MSLNTMCDSSFYSAYMSVAYKIKQNNFDAIFIQDKSKKLSSLICKLFCDKDICKIICQNNEIAIILVYLNTFFNKFNFKQLGK